MNDTLMILPSSRYDEIRLVKVPRDLDRNEAYRFATGIISHRRKRAIKIADGKISQKTWKQEGLNLLRR